MAPTGIWTTTRSLMRTRGLTRRARLTRETAARTDSPSRTAALMSTPTPARTPTLRNAKGAIPTIECNDAGCPDGQTCILWEEGCSPESCTCEDGNWRCNSDCDDHTTGSYVCAEDPEFCDDENIPSKDCRDFGCDDGMRCELGDGCRSGECYCHPGRQIMDCTADCNERYECVKDLGESCNGEPNPAGCTQTGCPDGQSCVNDSDVCAPSSCSCGEQGWVCTGDCGGGGTCQ